MYKCALLHHHRLDGNGNIYNPTPKWPLPRNSSDHLLSRLLRLQVCTPLSLRLCLLPDSVTVLPPMRGSKLRRACPAITTPCCGTLQSMPPYMQRISLWKPIDQWSYDGGSYDGACNFPEDPLPGSSIVAHVPIYLRMKSPCMRRAGPWVIR